MRPDQKYVIKNYSIDLALFLLFVVVVIYLLYLVFPQMVAIVVDAFRAIHWNFYL